MCARLYLNGDGIGKGTHLSLFVAIMLGEFDAVLSWPFKHKVTAMLLDQEHVEHLIDTFKPNPDSSSFQRPKKELNIASGFPLFCEFKKLYRYAYIREDTMFIKIIVEN